jgi:hypothetical protein
MLNTTGIGQGTAIDPNACLSIGKPRALCHSVDRGRFGRIVIAATGHGFVRLSTGLTMLTCALAEISMFPTAG